MKGYSYSLSLSEAPDYDDEATYVAALTAAGYESDDIDRLTASSVDVFSDLSPYNKDPMAQITSGGNITPELCECCTDNDYRWF